MPLSVTDLHKIEKLLNPRFERLEKGQQELKHNQHILQDTVFQIRTELDTEHVIRKQQIDTNTKDVKMIKQHLNLSSK